jgi:hypothetical protein
MRPAVGVRGGAVLATLLGIAAIPAVGYSAHAKKPDWVCSTTASNCATLVVHVDAVGGCPPGHPECPSVPEETKALRIAKLGSAPRCKPELQRCWGTVLSSWQTVEHKLRVAPGHYGVAVIPSVSSRGGGSLDGALSKEVTVSSGEEREIMIGIRRF